MRIVEPLDDPQWENRLRSWSGATVFHTSAWARVLKESYGFRPLALCEGDDVGFRALLPLMEVKNLLTGCRAVSLPFSDYCEPLLPDTRRAEDLIEILVPIARERGWKSCEIRGGDRLFWNLPSSAVFSLHSLNLGLSEPALFRALEDSAARNIRKARREGVTVSRDSSLASLKKFYRLHCNTRREHGLPPQSFSFFRNVHSRVLSQGLGEVFLASIREKPVAGAVFFRFGSKVLFKYGASDKRFLAVRPNDFLIWEAVRWYAAQGCQEMCFGRTETAQSGLRRFKGKWGAEERTLRYYRYEFDERRFVTSRQAAGSAVSRMLIRRLPLMFARLAGKLLYRHVA